MSGESVVSEPVSALRMNEPFGMQATMTRANTTTTDTIAHRLALRSRGVISLSSCTYSGLS